MTLTEVHIKLLQQLEAEPRSSSRALAQRERWRVTG
jgi:hypothetical protein